MIPLTDEENKSYKKQKICYICKKGFSTNDDDNKKYHHSHKKKIVWKHGLNWLFYALMLRTML